MLTTGDFKKGTRLLLDGEPYTLLEYSVQTPSARGAATLVRARLRNIITGVLLDRTFKAGEKFDEPDVQFRQVQCLYSDGEAFHFMDGESYEQHALRLDTLGDDAPWLADGMQVYAVIYNGRMVGVTLPPHVEIEVSFAGPGSKGDTASGKTLKDAELANGLTIKVPLFIESGERILVDPKTREFVRRAK